MEFKLSKILVISDTHDKNHELLGNLINKLSPIDLVIHAGDSECDLHSIRNVIGKTKLQIVSGNMDFASDFPAACVFDIGKSTVFLTHGHKYHVKRGLDRLVDAAKAYNADTIIFGHTHIPMLEEKSGITMLNPGSFSYPRSFGARPAFAFGLLDPFGNPYWKLCEYNEYLITPEIIPERLMENTKNLVRSIKDRVQGRLS